MEIKKNQPLIALFVLIFAVLYLRLFQLQVIEGEKYRQLAAANAAKTVAAPAPRGVIYDRHGLVLVENLPIYSVQVLPPLLANPNRAKGAAVLRKLGQILGAEVNYQVSAGQPIIVNDDIGLETAIKVEENKRELEGVVVNVRPARYYPYDDAAAHLLGYIGEIERNELARLRAAGYRLGDVIGKDGVEKYYDKYIRGVDGGKKIEVDVYGQPTRLLESLEPLPGADVKLTIDIELQTAAEEALAGKAGAVVVLDPRTGEILALASRPSYDPNVSWRSIAGRRHPFLNRALAIYPPGSTFKVVTLTAALEEKVARPEETFYCPGYYKINKRIARCWKEAGHGRITVKEGLTQSCDVVFYELGRRLGPERLAKYARAYGLGEQTGIDIPQEKRGLVPTEKWKKETLGEPWYEGDSINYGIGQGFLQVTPLQLAVVYGELAVGKRLKPYVVSEIKSRDGTVLFKQREAETGRPPLSNENLAVVREALLAVVERATGIVAKIPDFPAAGKTGTAQTPGLPHAWFICYAPAATPEVVVAAFVEHGEHGDRAAASVARDILKWYNENRYGKNRAGSAEARSHGS